MISYRCITVHVLTTYCMYCMYCTYCMYCMYCMYCVRGPRWARKFRMILCSTQSFFLAKQRHIENVGRYLACCWSYYGCTNIYYTVVATQELLIGFLNCSADYGLVSLADNSIDTPKDAPLPACNSYGCIGVYRVGVVWSGE